VAVRSTEIEFYAVHYYANTAMSDYSTSADVHVYTCHTHAWKLASHCSTSLGSPFWLSHMHTLHPARVVASCQSMHGDTSVQMCCALLYIPRA